jgi:hypothetical protein
MAGCGGNSIVACETWRLAGETFWRCEAVEVVRTLREELKKECNRTIEKNCLWGGGRGSFALHWILSTDSTLMWLRNHAAFMEPNGSQRLHRIVQPVPDLSQINPVHLPRAFLRLISICFPFTSTSTNYSFPLSDHKCIGIFLLTLTVANFFNRLNVIRKEDRKR